MRWNKYFLFFFIFLLSYNFSFKTIEITVKKEEKSFEKNLYLIKGMGYFDADAIRKIYGLNVELKENKKVAIGDKIFCKVNSNIVYIDREKRTLRKKPIIINSKLYIPLELFLTKSFSKATGVRSKWDFSHRILKVFKEGTYDFLKFYSFPDFDRFYFELREDKKVEVKEDREKKLLNVIIENPKFFDEKIDFSSELIKKVSFNKEGLSIYLTDEVESFSLKRINKDWVLDIKKKEKKTSPIPLSSFPSIEKKEKIKTIVIDPGHGGKDPGAIGWKGIREKDITLDIARRVAKKLHKKGFRVILTRSYDVYLPLSQRAMIANRRGGDIFISIHCNSSYRKRSRGVEVYFLSDKATDEEANLVAEFENAVLELEDENKEFQKVNQILWSLAMNKYMNESSLLGRTVLDEMQKYFPSPERGVKQAGFYVLRGVQMPSILIEVGFITNKKEAKLLSKRKYREKIAEAIAKGVLDYIDLKRRKK